jgi:CheY-like chemotaxis protein
MSHRNLHGDGAVAMQIAVAHEATIHLLLTDVIMPGMNGRHLADRLAELRPAIKVLYLSGYASDLIAQYGVLDPGILLLEKPFTLRALLIKVQQALGTSAKALAVGAS